MFNAPKNFHFIKFYYILKQHRSQKTPVFMFDAGSIPIMTSPSVETKDAEFSLTKILHWNNDWNLIMNLFCIRIEITVLYLKLCGDPSVVLLSQIPVYLSPLRVAINYKFATVKLPMDVLMLQIQYSYISWKRFIVRTNIFINHMPNVCIRFWNLKYIWPRDILIFQIYISFLYSYSKINQSKCWI